MTLDIEYLCSYYGGYCAPRVLVTMDDELTDSVTLTDALTDTVTTETLLLEENA